MPVILRKPARSFVIADMTHDRRTLPENLLNVGTVLGQPDSGAARIAPPGTNSCPKTSYGREFRPYQKVARLLAVPKSGNAGFSGKRKSRRARLRPHRKVGGHGFSCAGKRPAPSGFNRCGQSYEPFLSIYKTPSDFRRAVLATLSAIPSNPFAWPRPSPLPPCVASGRAVCPGPSLAR